MTDKKLYLFDFSTQLRHMRRGRPFCGATLGFPQDLFDNEKDWKSPLAVGHVLELVLFYGNADNERDKRARFAAALKVRDCQTTALTKENVDAIRKAIGALPTEPLGQLDVFLDYPVEVRDTPEEGSA